MVNLWNVAKNISRATFGSEVWAPFMPLVITAELVTSIQAPRILLRLNESHREHGIPRRVRWFENGIMETR